MLRINMYFSVREEIREKAVDETTGLGSKLIELEQPSEQLSRDFISARMLIQQFYPRN